MLNFPKNGFENLQILFVTASLIREIDLNSLDLLFET